MLIKYKQFINLLFPYLIVHPYILLIIFTPFIYINNLLYTILIVFNSFIRLGFPTSYKPLTQIKKGVIYSPLFSKIIATITDFIFYYIQSTYYGIGYYKLNIYIYSISVIFSWCYIILQCDICGFLESVICCMLQIYYLYYGNGYSKYIIIIPYLLYMILIHLPFNYYQINFNKLIDDYKISIITPNLYNLSWTIPSLLIQPLLFLIFNVYK